MREEGFDPSFVSVAGDLRAPTPPPSWNSHIEQGPVLDAEGVPVGIVTGIPGSRRLRAARVLGETNHSGATPRKYRRDAAIALAELAHRVDDRWVQLEAQGHALVCTFCVLATTEEAGFTRIAGEARFQLDVRSVNPRSVDALMETLYEIVPEIEARRGVRFELGAETASRAAPMDAAVQAGWRAPRPRSASGTGAMASGGGHDAAAFVQAGIPAGMVFVRNQNGSHNPNEAMRMEDFAQACAVVQRWAAEMAQ
jgi:N-carbamoyl-L-amino-acid hydrolase